MPPNLTIGEEEDESSSRSNSSRSNSSDSSDVKEEAKGTASAAIERSKS